MTLTSLLAAAPTTDSTTVAGIPIAFLAPAVTAVIAGLATWFSTRQSRASAHDEVIVKTAAVLAQDNADLRDEMREVKREAHAATVEARAARRRVGELEDALRSAGVPIPPDLSHH